MHTLTLSDRWALCRVAADHRVSVGAAEHMLDGLVAGRGHRAAFDHPELGAGCWTSATGGSVADGSMPDRLCHELRTVVLPAMDEATRPASVRTTVWRAVPAPTVPRGQADPLDSTYHFWSTAGNAKQIAWRLALADVPAN